MKKLGNGNALCMTSEEYKQSSYCIINMCIEITDLVQQITDYASTLKKFMKSKTNSNKLITTIKGDAWDEVKGICIHGNQNQRW